MFGCGMFRVPTRFLFCFVLSLAGCQRTGQIGTTRSYVNPEYGWSVSIPEHWIIDDADLESKLVFRTLKTFWSMTITDTANAKGAPVLTLPVSR